MPLGVDDDTNYPRRKIRTSPEDMFLLYSDAYIESVASNESEKMLGVKGVVQLLNENINVPPSEVIPLLRDQSARWQKETWQRMTPH